MSLLDEARAQSQRPGPKCNVQKAIAANPDLADEIAELLRAHDIGHADAGRVFVARGLGLTADTVQRHRAGDCTTCRDYGVTW